jgi:hypothetical protein
LCRGGFAPEEVETFKCFSSLDDEDVDVDDENDPVITELNKENMTALEGQGSG